MQVLGNAQNLISFDTDVDECGEGMHRCQQVCQNTIGSHTCDCNDGFMLGTDGRSCNGKRFLLPKYTLHYDNNIMMICI